MTDPRKIPVVVWLTEEEALQCDPHGLKLGPQRVRDAFEEAIRAALARTGEVWEGYEIPPEQACGLRAVHEAEEFDGSMRVTVIPHE